MFNKPMPRLQFAILLECIHCLIKLYRYLQHELIAN
jgi:hypothetical protein